MVAIQGRLTFLRYRRGLALAVTAAAAIVTWLALDGVRRAMGDVALASGWTLLAATLGLYGLSVRKAMTKHLRRQRLGPVSAWLQVHTYLGTFALVVFLWHIGWPVRGIFEIALATMFLTISISGIALLVASRRVPKQLSAVGIDYRLEDLPVIRADLAHRAHRIALDSSGSDAGSTLAEYYQRRLLPYFHSPRHWLYRCLPTGNKRRLMLRELEELDRYLDEPGVAYRQQLSSLVSTKDDIDFHQALQLRLRWMIAVHVALTWSLLLMIAAHITLVLRFRGGGL